MDVFNRPPTISEDTLFYQLYPSDSMADKATVTTLAVVMQDFAQSLLPDMQWHRDAFELKVTKAPDSDSYMLDGTMRVGDCVDDEWCAVWILREISSKWDVAIRVFDTDGEFLLIEAADHLPSWVTPVNATNRVWIYGSHMHLIPLEHVSSPTSKMRNIQYSSPGQSENEELEDFLSVHDAVNLVREPSEKTEVPENVEQAVWNRIAGYPEAARAHIHHTFAVVPVDIARALSVLPSLVQKAIETFYTRDALQLRAAHRMARFPPEPSVRCMIKMTRTSYAQLMGQKFYAPKVFGRVTETEDSPSWRWRDLGMKIACGFEMLYQESKGRTTSALNSEGKASADNARLAALQNNLDYQKYIDNLRNSGYFREELRGSRLWTDLEEKAAVAFMDVRRDDDASRPSFASQVDSAIQTSEFTFSNEGEAEDADDWLHVDAKDLDDLLEQKLHKQSDSQLAAREEDITQEQASRLKSLAQKVEDFIEGEGDLEGAHFADELLSDDESSDSEDESTDTEDKPTAMSDDERQSRKQAALDALVPAIQPSEYGKMPPSFHKNSQRVARDSKAMGSSEDSAKLASTPDDPVSSIRPPMLPRDQYEGVDSDDETDEDSQDGDSDDERPQLVDDLDIDMAEEQDEFLEFARHALGVSDEQWRDIVKEREGRGAFVPSPSTSGGKPQSEESSASTTAEETFRPARIREDTSSVPNLDSFEAVMRAMDVELARNSRTGTSPPTGDAKGKARADVAQTESDADIQAAMDTELAESLQLGTGEDDDDYDPNEAANVDYNLIKNFLESFKSQAGLSGPVSNLASRLQSGWAFPRDTS